MICDKTNECTDVSSLLLIKIYVCERSIAFVEKTFLLPTNPIAKNHFRAFFGVVCQKYHNKNFLVTIMMMMTCR